MKTLRYAAALAIAACATAAQDAAAQSSQQTVSYQVTAIDQITVSGTPSLVVNSSTAGNGLTAASASGSYAITTNGTNRKITAAIDTDMPADVTLTVSLAAPDNATSAGVVVLESTAKDVVTGITEVNQTGLSITYGLTADVEAGVVSAANKQVTYTITAGA